MRDERSVDNERAFLKIAKETIRACARRWKIPAMVANPPSILIGPRLRSTLATSNPTGSEIRLHKELRHADDAFIREILCHEAAHCALAIQSGPQKRPHGEAWRKLVTSAGYTPRTHYHFSALNRGGRPRKQQKIIYVHTCKVCQTTRTARKAMKQWRCASCVEAGYDGILQITTHPIRNGTDDQTG